MSHSNVFGLVRERGIPSTSDSSLWFPLIEARKAWMLEHIKELGTAKLGNTYHWRSRADLGTTIREDLFPGNLQNVGVNLDTRGIFLFDRATYGMQTSDRNRVSMLVYGFSREGTWIYAWIGLTLSGGEMVLEKKVRLALTSAERLHEELLVSPSRIFQGLGKIIEKHAERRAALAASAQEMWHYAQAENALLGIDR